MELNNAFEISLAPEQAWLVLLDTTRIAPCLPGAALLETIDPRTFKGRVSVRLGPVALAFTGIAKFVAIDADQKRARIEAQGTDQKGRGGAHAAAEFHLSPSANGTSVVIKTELNLSGAVAQYGRGIGMVQSVATQLIDQFAANLRAELARSAPPMGAPADAAVAIAAAPPPAAPPPARPIAGLTLLFQAFWTMLRRAFGAVA